METATHLYEISCTGHLVFFGGDNIYKASNNLQEDRNMHCFIASKPLTKLVSDTTWIGGNSNNKELEIIKIDYYTNYTETSNTCHFTKLSIRSGPSNTIFSEITGQKI
ncbi:hypothetical protein ACJX0J_013264, partial [Zea mays]